MGRPKKNAVADSKSKPKKSIPKKSIPKEIPKPYQTVDIEEQNDTDISVYTKNGNFVIEGIYSKRTVKNGVTVDFEIFWDRLAKHIKDSVP